MRILDLFCGAGGASAGYSQAGFEVTGVDISPQPAYPFSFVQMDVMDLVRAKGWMRGFDAVHASPPCQRFCAYRRRGAGVGETYPDLVGHVRQALRRSGLPYVIENVPGAPLRSPVRLCGSSFGLDVRRHRLFEASLPFTALPCDHGWQKPRFAPASNRTNLRSTVEIGVWRIPLKVQQQAMGIDWMGLKELSQAIPPAYTEYVGRQIRERL